ncbi:hypothetical protein EJ06DRAFT_407582 [Trichodelitschia bisporula]|uniref:Uncharacterized protein n=1 Tax=Trichodelitschia bisporula TaxID=703511 RepID=A0A6G1HYK0_9PEZI|nr:hypothetical protein EJ06DRAFT_407582 [Trichodelitschia bisporula]
MASASAVDIITYIGVPLAVLGVLPTLYTCLKSLLTLRDIRRTLDRNGVASITRSSLLSGIIEIEIPRKSIAPLDRYDAPYFELSPAPSTLKGGSWTVFNWRELSIGTKGYRLQYHDELHQPQAEIEFAALLAFLLDRGAVIAPDGFSDLRGSGLWTPVGTKLLVSPCSAEAVLSVSASDDSDGILSLTLYWEPGWDRRSVRDLPPYWMELHEPTTPTPSAPTDLTLDSEDAKPSEPEIPASEAEPESAIPDSQASDSKSDSISLHSLKRQSHLSAQTALTPTTLAGAHTIRLRLGPFGLSHASHGLTHQPLRFPHLLPSTNDTNLVATWFACGATALGAPTNGLWSYAIPSAIHTLAQREVVPCGVLVLLSALAEDAVPVWRAPFDDRLEVHERAVKAQARMRRMMEEGRLPPAEAAKARQARFLEENHEMMAEMGRRRLREEQKAEREIKEALGSQRLGVGVVADANVRWLVEKGYVQPEATVAVVVEGVLWGMMAEAEMARAVADMLETWRNWADGGMTKGHVEMLKREQLTFAYASCVMALIRETSGGESGSIVGDLQECLRMWRKVRLG